MEMENQEVLRSKPLSYEASKTVLKSLSLKTREAINRRIPALCTINFRLPYVLENVVITREIFETDGRRWYPTPAAVHSSENSLRQVMNARKSELTILQEKLEKEPQYCVNKSCEEILEQLFDEYIRDGTVVRGSLCLWSIPEFLKRRRENERDLKMKVTTLELKTKEAEDYEHFIRFTDLDVMENVKIVGFGNALPLLDKPEGIHDLQLFVKSWITIGREIGTRFSWVRRRFEDVLDILDHLKTHFGAVQPGSNLEYYFSRKKIYGNSVTVKLGDDRELVMFCHKINIPSGIFSKETTIYTFEMEVVASRENS
ncbi:hypothetical protein CRE_16008 [Caenorhabditis remanei]|uniref:DUF38 domain-containing protein n=1 Tax=Caenorhabditis remanei TaxID=31234 RepID=E3MBB3_CAERE|nr:hypothetical protein CRE_16008 [Caenorhabditis remanei]